MKELNNIEQMNQVAGGSVHWHQRPDGKLSGGGDFLGSLTNDFSAHRTNPTTNKAVAGIFSTSIGAIGGPVGAAIGFGIAQLVGYFS